ERLTAISASQAALRFARVEKSRNEKRTARLILCARSPTRKTDAAWVSMRLTGVPSKLAGSLRKSMTACCESSAVIAAAFDCGAGKRGIAGQIQDIVILAERGVTGGIIAIRETRP